MKDESLSVCPAALLSPVYRYVVTHTPSAPVDESSDLMPFASRFSFHRLDALALFGGLEAVLGRPPSDRDRSFRDLLTRHLVHFARTGEGSSWGLRARVLP